MIKFRKLFAAFLGLFMVAGIVSGCDKPGKEPKDKWVDYTAQLKLNTNDGKAWEQVTVRNCIDGDTTHFNSNVPEDTNLLKARYLAIDTPESTGLIEPWGKAASKYNKSKLMAEGVQVIIQSDSAVWEKDSTGERYLCWVWYKLPDQADYRLLNLELVQEGLSKTKNWGSTTYGEWFGKAYNQALAAKIKVPGNETDPDFDYGQYPQVTLKEIMTHLSDYADKNVRFEATITYDAGGNKVYVEDYDTETETYYGIGVFYGFNFSGIRLMKVGYRLSFAATISITDNYGVQATSLHYYAYSPNRDDALRVVEEDVEVKPTEITAKYYKEHLDDLLNTRVIVKGLEVVSVYTTTNEVSSSKGAMTLNCKAADGTQVQIRTNVLYEADGTTLVTAAKYEGKTIDITGICDKYENEYQIRVYLTEDIIAK